MKKKILSALILIALLFSAVSVIYAESPPSKTVLTDVKNNKWYTDAVNTVFNEGIMTGKSSEYVNGDLHVVFAPFANMTRAELVTILSRLASADTTGCAKSLTFKDTKKSAWYADAVGWAVSSELVTGYDDNTFRPNAQVLRQELAVLFARFLKANYTELPSVENPNTFTDAKKIPDWASEGVEAMRLTGIVGGDEKGNFNPKKSANRAEIAVMLTRYLTALEDTVDPMYAKFDNINDLVKREMNKIVINLYLYERLTDYGHVNSVSEQLLPQMWLSTKKYEMVADDAALVKLNESIIHGISAADEETDTFFIKPVGFFIRNKETGEVTETKALGLKINRIVTPDGLNLTFDAGLDVNVYSEMLARSYDGNGDVARFAKSLNKLMAGEDVTIGYIGGSITQGAVSGQQRQHSWARVTTEWFGYHYPDSKITYVNAGIGGTPSDYGNYRAETHLLGYDPDIIFIEFSVNDNDNNAFQHETYEALVRRALNDENSPAVILVISALATDKAIENAYEIANYYGLPVINVDAGVNYGIEADEFTMAEYCPDGIHPYEWGHKIMGDMVTSTMFRLISRANNALEAELEIKAVPTETLTPCTRDNLKYIGAGEFSADEIGSFTLTEGNDNDPSVVLFDGKSYISGTNGAKMSFTVEAKTLTLLGECENVTVSINGQTTEISGRYDFAELYVSDTATTLNVEITANAETLIYGFAYN